MNADHHESSELANRAATGIRCWIGLGSNLGDRLQALRDACALLDATSGVRIRQTSSVYELAPWGYADQPPFLNAVARVETTLGPIQIVTRLQSIERLLGRRRRFRWGPREIDLDLLLYDDESIQRRGLTVPHASIEQRAFVLAPLREIFPTFQGENGVSIDQLLARVDPDGRTVRLAAGRTGLLVR